MKRLLYLMIAMTFVLSCAGPQIKSVRVESASLIKNITPEKQAEQATQVKGTLTLLQALQLALQNNPELSAFSLELRAREAAALQASLLPNPELDIEVENFAGGGPLGAFKATETTISVGQLIELAGKRPKRTEVANLETELAAWDLESKKLAVYTEVVKAFNEVLAAQQQVKLNREILKITEDFKQQVARRVQAGRTSPAELARANVEISRTVIALEQSKRQLQAARKRLAATWGATEVTFDSVGGQLEIVDSLPSLTTLLKALESNPQLLKQQTETKSKQAQLRLAQAFRVPDPVISLGYRRINEIDQQAFVAGLSLPLTLFDRNQGAIKEASLRLEQNTLQQKATRLQLQTQLTQLYQNLSAVHQAVQSLQNEIIPQAQEAFETISQGYKMGKFNFLQVLDARRSLISARETYLQQLAEFQRLRAEIEGLTAKSINELK